MISSSEWECDGPRKRSGESTTKNAALQVGQVESVNHTAFTPSSRPETHWPAGPNTCTSRPSRRDGARLPKCASRAPVADDNDAATPDSTTVAPPAGHGR